MPTQSTSVQWAIKTTTLRGQTIPIARLVVRLHFPTILADERIVPEQCWLDSGAPISVIPFHVHHDRLLWEPVGGIETTWAAQPCDLGRIQVWLPPKRRSGLDEPLSMLAKFARRDPPGEPAPILLGLEFFLANRASLTLPPPPRAGAIRAR